MSLTSAHENAVENDIDAQVTEECYGESRERATNYVYIAARSEVRSIGALIVR